MENRGFNQATTTQFNPFDARGILGLHSQNITCANNMVTLSFMRLKSPNNHALISITCSNLVHGVVQELINTNTLNDWVKNNEAAAVNEYHQLTIAINALDELPKKTGPNSALYYRLWV